MKKVNKNLIISILFLCVVFYFGSINFVRIYPSIKTQFKNETNKSLKQKIYDAQETYRSSFYKKDKLIDLYGIIQLHLHKNMIGNFEFVKDNNEVMHILESPKDLYSFNNDMMELSTKLKVQKIPFLYVQVPARELNNYTEMPIGAVNYSNSSMDNILKSLKKNNIDYIDIRDEINKEKVNKGDVFFKTDLHMKTEAEFWIAKKIANESMKRYNLKLENIQQVFEQNNYNIINKDFLGNLAHSAGQYYAGLDKFTMYIPKFNTNYTLTNYSKNVVKNGSFQDVVMNGNEKDPNNGYRTYWITNYLQWPSPYYNIENKNIKKNNILVIMDSNGLRITSFLSLMANNVTVVDTRYQGKQNYIDKAIASKKYDLVIMIQGTTLVDSKILPGKLKNPQAEIISNTTPTKIDRGKKYDVNIKVKNTSGESWSESKEIRLCIFQDGHDFGYRVKLPEDVEVKPNDQYIFTLHDFQAPPSNTTYLEYQMVEEGITYFGEKERVDITVKN